MVFSVAFYIIDHRLRRKCIIRENRINRRWCECSHKIHLENQYRIINCIFSSRSLSAQRAATHSSIRTGLPFLIIVTAPQRRPFLSGDHSQALTSVCVTTRIPFKSPLKRFYYSFSARANHASAGGEKCMFEHLGELERKMCQESISSRDTACNMRCIAMRLRHIAQRGIKLSYRRRVGTTYRSTVARSIDRDDAPRPAPNPPGSYVPRKPDAKALRALCSKPALNRAWGTVFRAMAGSLFFTTVTDTVLRHLEKPFTCGRNPRLETLADASLWKRTSRGRIRPRSGAPAQIDTRWLARASEPASRAWTKTDRNSGYPSQRKTILRLWEQLSLSFMMIYSPENFDVDDTLSGKSPRTCFPSCRRAQARGARERETEDRRKREDDGVKEEERKLYRGWTNDHGAIWTCCSACACIGLRPFLIGPRPTGERLFSSSTKTKERLRRGRSPRCPRCRRSWRHIPLRCARSRL